MLYTTFWARHLKKQRSYGEACSACPSIEKKKLRRCSFYIRFEIITATPMVLFHHEILKLYNFILIIILDLVTQIKKKLILYISKIKTLLPIHLTIFQPIKK